VGGEIENRLAIWRPERGGGQRNWVGRTNRADSINLVWQQSEWKIYFLFAIQNWQHSGSWRNKYLRLPTQFSSLSEAASVPTLCSNGRAIISPKLWRPETQICAR